MQSSSTSKNPAWKKLFLPPSILALIILAGCFQPYQLDIQQGNIVNKEQIESLQTGMTQREVRFLLGTPLIKDPFHANRWDYYFSLRQGTGKINQHNLSLIFNGNSLAEIRRSESVEAGLPTSSEDPKATPSRNNLFQRLWDQIRLRN
jgi:outer membrane protein assembly factor BamE